MIILVIVALYLAAGIIVAIFSVPYAKELFDENYTKFSEYRTLLITGALIWAAIVGPAMIIKSITIWSINNVISHFKKEEP